VLIFLASTYQPYGIISDIWLITAKNLVPFILGGGVGNGGDLQLGNGGKAVGYGDVGGAKCAECLT